LLIVKQHFLYETISKLREKGMTYNQIADHLNKRCIPSVGVKKLKDAHVYFTIKRKSIEMKN